MHHGGAIHLHDEGAREGLSPGSDRAQGHLALVPPGGENRRAGPEWRRQEHDPQGDGRDREGVPGRSVPGRRREHRVPGAGALARPLEDRPRQRRGGGRPHEGAPDPLRRVERQARRAARARRDGEGPRGARQAPGPDRRRRGLGTGLEARTGHGRPALPAAGRRRPHPVGRGAAPRRAVPAAAAIARPAAARRAHQPSRRRVGGVARALPARLSRHGGGRHPRPLFPRQRRGLDPGTRSGLGHSVAGQLLVMARAEAEAPRD